MNNQRPNYQQPYWVGSLQLSSQLKIGRNNMLKHLRSIGAYTENNIANNYKHLMKLVINERNGFKTYTPLFNIDALRTWEAILKDVPKDAKKENFGRVKFSKSDLDMMQIVGG